jgi:hypothetical protein
MRFDSVGFHAALLATAVILAGCDEGSSGGVQSVYFSSSNYQGCATEYVRFRAIEYGEVLRKDDGNLDCTISPGLADAGCTLELGENDSSDSVLATVDGCRVPNDVNLFSCEFRDPDFFALNTEANVHCGCLAYEDSCYVNGICDMCASRDAERGACEDCTNNLDDDGDKRIDCSDRDCEFTDECGFGRSTITCINSTSTTTTSTSTTTDTVPEMSFLSDGEK